MVAGKPHGPIAANLLAAIQEKKQARAAEHKAVADAVFKQRTSTA